VSVPEAANKRLHGGSLHGGMRRVRRRPRRATCALVSGSVGTIAEAATGRDAPLWKGLKHRLTRHLFHGGDAGLARERCPDEEGIGHRLKRARAREDERTGAARSRERPRCWPFRLCWATNRPDQIGRRFCQQGALSASPWPLPRCRALHTLHCNACNAAQQRWLQPCNEATRSPVASSRSTRMPLKCQPPFLGPETMPGIEPVRPPDP
jgi:hypothetical protein